MKIDIKIKNDISFASACAIAHEMTYITEKLDQNEDINKTSN